MAVNLSEIIAPSFYGLHHKIVNCEYSSYWLKGGRGSTKSSFTAIEIILGMVKDSKANALVVRKIDNTIRDSVMQTLLWAIDMLDLNDYFRHTKSPAEIIYLPTGQKIIMKGLDDPRKLKSIRLQRGYFKYLWFEEADEFYGIEEIRNVEQSALRGGDEFVEIITYNPPNDPAAWVNKESLVQVHNRYVHESNYKDVPPHWLGKRWLDDAELLRKLDPLRYDHEYLGLSVGRAEQIVFHGKWEELDFETPPTSELYQSRFFYGVDWGFSNDPTALIRCFIQVKGGEKYLYIDHEAGGVGIEIKELPQLFRSFVEAKRWKIYADCSQPQTISYIKSEGFNIAGAPKWDGSIEDGIVHLQGRYHKIYIHPRCRNTIEEFKKYSYKVDRHTQEVSPVVVDKYNHYIDAIRYALADYIKNKVSILDVI